MTSFSFPPPPYETFPSSSQPGCVSRRAEFESQTEGPVFFLSFPLSPLESLFLYGHRYYRSTEIMWAPCIPRRRPFLFPSRFFFFFSLDAQSFRRMGKRRMSTEYVPTEIRSFFLSPSPPSFFPPPGQKSSRRRSNAADWPRELYFFFSFSFFFPKILFFLPLASVTTHRSSRGG